MSWLERWRKEMHAGGTTLTVDQFLKAVELYLAIGDKPAAKRVLDQLMAQVEIKTNG